mgnify:CR=1 FL=1
MMLRYRSFRGKKISIPFETQAELVSLLLRLEACVPSGTMTACTPDSSPPAPFPHRGGDPHTGHASLIINIRMPRALIGQMDRHIAQVVAATGERVNRGTILRRALEAFLKEE